MNQLHSAYILHHRPYRETSLLLDLFTADHGRLSAIARGIRKPKSRQRGIFQPFTPLLMSWYGKGELVTLTTTEPQGGFIQLQGECLASAFYLNELLIRALPKQDPHAHLYTIYHDTLLELHHRGSEDALSMQKILRRFEKQLLAELGYALPLAFDCAHRPLDEDASYYFFPEKGFERCEQNEKHFTMMSVFSGDHLLKIAQEIWDDESVLRDAKRLMRMALVPLIGGQPIQSRKLFLMYE